MDLKLNGKTAFISGSTQGIGFAIAQSLLKEGARVIINGRTESKVAEAVQKLNESTPGGGPPSGMPPSGMPPGGNARGFAADFSKVDEVNALLQQLPDIDILINNAGIFEPKPFTEISDEEWFRFFEVNVLSGVRLARYFFPKMIAKDWGRIIFISSESAVNIPEEMIHYGTTKTAQLAVSRGLAELTKGTNVTVNTVMPGPTKSEGVADFVRQLGEANNMSAEEAEKDFFKNARPTSLLQRFASVEEIANLVTYVASPLSSGTNGSALKVDGGVAKFII
ncbi:SDR family NAD(P)-dependent oxidoreductase [Dyadobacter fermentans]|uniref:Short-chain dehydrogenase/reductase SDR n=1 Tax=Dyadobacter fermentans (strain ATCC 700827 / DSM 18053 / CIP 107007 / KCTC 52180 / NS114) TaxID=471854 RepID=C6VSX6_DYAFD|nr:SDR family oxidoreductase [Dyadobacter fermentans]ACT94621.1 short-chain dehydrogenase/reductase SDR [Dyadobacter fermentans DSM 18053]